MNQNIDNSCTKKKWLKSCNAWLLLFNLILAGFNIWLLSTNAPRKYNFDYMGVIVATFGIMVTLLVAWNIYNSVDVKESVSMLNKHERDIQRLEENKQDKKIKTKNNPTKQGGE